MNIAIIGGGYVGLHTAIRLAKLNKEFEIKVLDNDKDKITRFNSGESPINDFFMSEFMKSNPGYLNKISYEQPDDDWTKFDIVFISLSTNPSKEDPARLSTDLIFNYVERIKSSNNKISIIIRSTINIDDGYRIEEENVGYWPEFLSQGVETIQNINQSVNVVSLPEGDKISDGFFLDLFNGKTLIKTSVKESILIKIMHNTLDAHLISISNLFANISEENNINFSSVAPAVESLLSKRTKVKRPGIGYGGSCYPKDSYSLIKITNSTQNKKLVQALEDFNNEQSYVFLSKEKVIREAENVLVLGVSFKGGTNDTTRTPTTSLRTWLHNEGIEYKVWEPMISSKWVNKWENIPENIEEEIKESDLVIVSSDWKEFNELLLNYDGNVIDLKTFIKDNGMMNLYRIGEPDNLD